ncbi:hypothetical protein CHUAL_003827 [Chamberlinius hualienensis]
MAVKMISDVKLTLCSIATLTASCSDSLLFLAFMKILAYLSNLLNLLKRFWKTASEQMNLAVLNSTAEAKRRGKVDAVDSPGKCRGWHKPITKMRLEFAALIR